MSVTFHINSTTTTTKVEACLCAQMAPNWLAFVDGEVSEAEACLSEHADPNCPLCGGRGVEVVEYPEEGTSINFCNENAWRLLAVIGLVVDCVGRVSVEALPDAIRGCIRALNSAKVREAAIRESFEVVHPEYTVAVVGDDGLTHIERQGGGGVFSIGIDDEGVCSRIESLLHLFRLAQERGECVFWG
jgi:hypothetical protein